MRNISELPVWMAECKCTNIIPVTVTIGKQSWPGCEYTQHFEWQRDQDAVRWGEKKAGDTYTKRSIYCVGALPLEKKPKRHKYPLNRVCFTRNDGLDWYVAAYIPLENLKPVFEPFHPFGINFILAPWDLPEKIDHYEKPYKRYPLTVTPRT